MSPVAAHDLRVASVPGGHPYVRHLELGRAGVTVLPDPRPAGAPPERWWPPVMLDPAWIERHHDAFDVMHIHFGCESLTVDQLSDALDALDRAGRPLVYTVHDLEHPQLTDQAHHRRQLDLLIARARALITLTPGAAAAIVERWGRRATVIAHPRMLPSSEPLPAGPRPRAFTVGLHLRDLRPNISGTPTVRALADALGRLRGAGISAQGRVVLFERVRDQAAAAAIEAICRDAPDITLVRCPPLSFSALVTDLSGLDASLLPYRHGTHSGWAELCWDLGLPAVAGPVGYVAEQHDDPGWLVPCRPDDATSLATALAAHPAARRTGAPDAPDHGRWETVSRRRRLREEAAPALAAAHRRVYEQARS